MPSTEVSTYPWQSRSVFVAQLDGDGKILRANDSLRDAFGPVLDGVAFAELIAAEQRDTFRERLAAATEAWDESSFGFDHARGGSAEDRCLWLRRLAGDRLEVVAEPAWQERDRLLEQVLELNDDLIVTQRDLARRQRELEQAKEDAARSTHRLRQLEAIMLAAVTPRNFEGALNSLLSTAQKLLPGDRADILLLDEASDRLVLSASAGPGAPPVPDRSSVAMGEGLLGRVASRDTSTLVADLSLERRLGPVRDGSMIATPLRLEGHVIGVLVAAAAARESFTDSDLSLLEVVSERVALAVGQAQQRDRERRLGETLQRALLPQSLPELSWVELAARYRPLATGVGGDFYDAVELPDGSLSIAIGDVTGKGLRAAATMGRLRSALHAYTLDTPEPSEVLSRLGRLATLDGAIATAMHLRLDPHSHSVRLASAGHLPPLLVCGSDCSYVDIKPALSPPLGLTVEHRSQMQLDLPVGSTLLLYTDGLVERTHNIDQGLDALAAAAAQAPQGDLDVLCAHLLGALAPGGRYRDDVAILALRRT